MIYKKHTFFCLNLVKAFYHKPDCICKFIEKSHSIPDRLVAQASARMTCADLDTIPVCALDGKKETLKLTENPLLLKFMAGIPFIIPESLKDSEQNER